MNEIPKEKVEESIQDFINSFYVYKISSIIKESLDRIKKKNNEITDKDRDRAIKLYSRLMRERGLEPDVDWIINYN